MALRQETRVTCCVAYPRVTFISSATRYTWNLSEVKATMHNFESPSTEIPSMLAIPALDTLNIDYYYCPFIGQGAGVVEIR